MNTKTINAEILSRMFLSGAKNLEAKKEWINELNVFPVPDGDTGTNMSLTILAAANAVAGIENMNMETLAKAISSGSLRGARGNSGVILSQLFRGFTREINKYEELDSIALAAAMEKGVETAYKAVMKPKEGTILTVAKEAARKATEICTEEEILENFFAEIFAHADATLQKTPEMLPVLKEAGVVDSGGQGLLEVFRGAIDGFLGNEVDYSQFQPTTGTSVQKISRETEEEIKFGYCTEFIILLNKPLPEEEIRSFKHFLNSLGDSIVLVADDEIVKVHVHTNHPGQALEKALTYGALSHMKIDNMREEHQEKLIKDAERLAKEQAREDEVKALAEQAKEYGFIAVSSGEGLSDIFHDLGVDYIIQGGQTMNPSTEDMLNAISMVNAHTIYILPNNKNIILAANQARDLTEDKKIVVVPSKTIPQGVSAMISFVPERSAEENLEGMAEAASLVKTGEITYAVRDTRLNEKDIHEGDMMGIGDNGVLAVGKNVAEVALETVREMTDEDSEVISVYYGNNIEEFDAEAFTAKLEKEFPDCDVELNYGGQPIYSYIISVE